MWCKAMPTHPTTISLFQIFSDDAMGWTWGDLGALFVYLRPFDLKVRRFRRAYAWLDGH